MELWIDSKRVQIVQASISANLLNADFGNKRKQWVGFVNNFLAQVILKIFGFVIF